MFRRAVWPLRDAITELRSEGSRLITEPTRLYLRDCHDHVIQVIDLLESYREICADLRDFYLSSISNRMNEVMKTLTVITVLFMPLTFLTGYFGMNFFEPPGSLGVWTTEPVFYLTLAVILIMPLIMYLWMRRRTWV